MKSIKHTINAMEMGFSRYKQLAPLLSSPFLEINLLGICKNRTEFQILSFQYLLETRL